MLVVALLSSALAVPEPTLVVVEAPRPAELDVALGVLRHPEGSPPLVRAGPVAGGRWVIVDTYGGSAYAWAPGAPSLSPLGVALPLNVGEGAFVVHAGGSLAVLDEGGAHLVPVGPAVGHAIRPLAVDGEGLIGLDTPITGEGPRAVRLTTAALTPLGPPLRLSDWTFTTAVTARDGHLHVALWRRADAASQGVDDGSTSPVVELAEVDVVTGRLQRLGLGAGSWSMTNVPRVEVDIVFAPSVPDAHRCANVIDGATVHATIACGRL